MTTPSAPADTGIAASRWRHLSVGALETVRGNLEDALLGGLLALPVTIAIALLGGIAGEELMAPSATATTLDLTSRASLAAVAVLAVLGVLARGLVIALRGPLMARALAAAMRAGTPPTEVPAPLQWQHAHQRSDRAYRRTAIILLAILGPCMVVVVPAALQQPFASGLAIIAGSAAGLGLIGLGIPLTGTVLRRRQLARLAPVDAHWTQAHRIIAAGRVLTSEAVAEARAGEPERGHPGTAARRLGKVATALVGAGATAAYLGIQVMAALAFPDRQRWAGGLPGERADLGPEGERLVDLAVTVCVVGGAVAILALLARAAAALVERAQEQAALRRALEEDAAPPPYPVLQRYLLRPSAPLLRVVSALVGVTMVVGGTLLDLHLVVDAPGWGSYAGAGPGLREAAALGPRILVLALMVGALAVALASLLEARERRLRDAVLQRWPVRPTPAG